MKKNLRYIRLFGTAFLACLFGAACQDDIDTGSNDGQAPVQTAEGYVKVDINLPVTTGVGTRAAKGDYDDGAPAEYQVNDAIIVFFEGTNESKATFKKAYSLTNLNWTDSNEDQVTTTSHPYVTEAPKATTDRNNIYALMVLNPNNVLTVSDGKLMQRTTAVFSSDQNTVSALQKVLKEQKVEDYTNKDNVSSFFMTSAPLSNKSCEAGDFNTATASILTKVTVYDTEEKAAAPGVVAAPIYVERIVAKVSMDVNSDIINETQTPKQDNATIVDVSSDTSYKGDYVELQGWVLNVTNKSTKLVRDVQDFSTWISYESGKGKRFVESDAVETTGVNLYRINWAIDGNYSGTGYTADDFNTWTEESNEPTTWNTNFIGNGNVAYCFENTFNAANMKQNQTTGLLIKGVYTHNGETEEEDFFVVGNQAAALTFNQFVQIVKDEVSDLNDKEITLKEVDGGYYNVDRDGRKLSDLLDVKDYSGTELNRVIDAIGKVKYYKDGATYYYTSLIRHFSDGETQWDNGETYNDADHLGRYGVVRNTWYQMKINSISGPGEPEIPVIPDEPDDEKQGYIKMEVNILAWAVRNNGIDL